MWLVIGYGSALHSDDGFGPVVAEQIRALTATGGGARTAPAMAPVHGSGDDPIGNSGLQSGECVMSGQARPSVRCIPYEISTLPPSMKGSCSTTGADETPALPAGHGAGDTIPSPATMGAAIAPIGNNEEPAPTGPQPDSSSVIPSIRLHPEAGFTPVAVITAIQLTPDLAEPVSRAHGVIFIDASLDRVPGRLICFHLPPARPRMLHGRQACTHHCTPILLLDTALALYGQAPPGWLYTTGAINLDLGESLSPIVAQTVPRAVDLIMDRLRGPRPSF
jgi:Ni,Fe-hydrogenase maturation factor